MAKQFFGTDGIRGAAGQPPLDAATVHAVGSALGRWAAEHAKKPVVLIGMDTRESGPLIASQIAGGLLRHGVEPRFAGLITTPGVAYLTRIDEFVAGVMISASHNPYQDNGIKVFDHSGFKLPDEQEAEIEREILRVLAEGHTVPEPVALTVDPGLDAQYIDFLASTTAASFKGLKLVLDCAHGSASHLAPELFSRLGAAVIPIACAPNGRNINENCGALFVEALRERVVAEGAHAGVAFDGDADRAILVSASGKVIDGDHVLLLAAVAMQGAGKLQNNGSLPMVIATVMSNLGLERALEAHGIGMVRTAVGDKYVLEEMVRRGALLGGEQSGHVIFREYATTGDGLLTALRVLEIMQQSGKSLDQLTKSFQVYPQLLVNIRVSRKLPLAALPTVQEEIRLAEEGLGASGRVSVRFSGTEPLARVMVEGSEAEAVTRYAHRIADSIREALADPQATPVGAVAAGH